MKERQKTEEKTGEEGNENNDDVGEYLVDLPGGPGEDVAGDTPTGPDIAGAEVKVAGEPLVRQVKF